jgi:hypothetical protein
MEIRKGQHRGGERGLGVFVDVKAVLGDGRVLAEAGGWMWWWMG